MESNSSSITTFVAGLKQHVEAPAPVATEGAP